MKPTTNLKNNIGQGSNLPALKEEAVPIVGSLDYYIYARNFPKISKVLEPAGDMKKFDTDLKELLKKAVIDLGHVAAHMSETHQKSLLESLRSQVFNYFSHYTMEDLKLCFHNGIRGKYGPVTHLAIATIHRWMEGFKQDEDRILAIKSEEAKIEQLKRELEDTKKKEPKLKYLQLYSGLVSTLDQFHGIGDAGKLAWIYYDDFVRMEVLDLPYHYKTTFYDQARQSANSKTKEVDGVYAKKIIIENHIEASELTVDREAKRLAFEWFIRECFKQNYSVMSMYEEANTKDLFKMEHPEESPEFWDHYYFTLTNACFEDYLNTRSFRGFHAVIYNWLVNSGHLKKLITDQEKDQAIGQAQEDLYEVYSAYKSSMKPTETDGILKMIKTDPKNSPQIKYEAKFLLLKLFYKKVKEQNLKLADLFYGNQQNPQNQKDPVTN